jgi:hypothetical protein
MNRQRLFLFWLVAGGLLSMAGETLYNGFELPAQWPPKQATLTRAPLASRLASGVPGGGPPHLGRARRRGGLPEPSLCLPSSALGRARRLGGQG